MVNVQPTYADGANAAMSALPWNSGIAQYVTSLRTRPRKFTVPSIASRPVEHMTALGAPVEPEVNSSASSVCGSRAASDRRGSAPACSASRACHRDEPAPTRAAAPVSRSVRSAAPSSS